LAAKRLQEEEKKEEKKKKFGQVILEKITDPKALENG